MEQWLEVTIRTASGGIDLLCAELTEAGFDSFVIDDSEQFRQFLDGARAYWDYVDEKLAARMRDKLRVHVQGHFAREVCGGAVEHVFQAPSGDAADGAGGGESQSHGFLAYLRKCMRPVYPVLGRPLRIAAFQR